MGWEKVVLYEWNFELELHVVCCGVVISMASDSNLAFGTPPDDSPWWCCRAILGATAYSTTYLRKGGWMKGHF